MTVVSNSTSIIRRSISSLVFLSAALQSSVFAQAVSSHTPHIIVDHILVDEVVTNLNHPWSFVFLPDNKGILITEKSGNLLLWTEQTGATAITGLPSPIYTKGQGGLLDVAIDPDFVNNQRVYLSFSEAGEDGKAGTAVSVGTLVNNNLQNVKVIFRQTPKLSTGNHFGSRFVFDEKGHLFITLGENNQRPTAQDLSHLQGKIVRINTDGTIPADNPFKNTDNAQDAIWSYGHRNAQGAAFNPWTKELWINEHGPRGGDEINIPQAGKNYGWPIATYGINYSGFAIPEARGGQVAGTEQPIYYWEKSPGISGMAFYNHDRYPEWQHAIFIGALKGRALIRLTLKDRQITREEWLLTDRKERIRDVRVGPDGAVYALTDENPGKLLRIKLHQ